MKHSWASFDALNCCLCSSTYSLERGSRPRDRGSSTVPSCMLVAEAILHTYILPDNICRTLLHVMLPNAMLRCMPFRYMLR